MYRCSRQLQNSLWALVLRGCQHVVVYRLSQTLTTHPYRKLRNPIWTKSVIGLERVGFPFVRCKKQWTQRTWTFTVTRRLEFHELGLELGIRLFTVYSCKRTLAYSRDGWGGLYYVCSDNLNSCEIQYHCVTCSTCKSSYGLTSAYWSSTVKCDFRSVAIGPLQNTMQLYSRFCLGTSDGRTRICTLSLTPDWPKALGHAQAFDKMTGLPFILTQTP